MHDVIVVGVGTMGAAACAELARRGAKVLGVEQFDIPHALGAHHGRSRMFRLAYFEHPDYVPLLKRAFNLWKRLEKTSGVKVFHVTGGVYLGRPDGDTVGKSAASAERHGLDHALLDPAERLGRFPQFTLPDDYAALYEPTAGFVVPELAVGAMASEALRHGAELHGREAVLDWSSDASGVRVRTDRAEYRAEKLVFAAGAWSSRLVRNLGVPLIVTRQTLGWFAPRDPAPFRYGEFPVWAFDAPDGSLYYGFPILPDHPGFKIARHQPGPPTDPDTVIRTPLPGDESDLRAALVKHIPDADGPLLSLIVCFYTNSPDSHFIIDRHPMHERVTIACGFSGHGFKFAPVVGEILADLAMHGKTTLPAQFLGLPRFGPMR